MKVPMYINIYYSKLQKHTYAHVFIYVPKNVFTYAVFNINAL